jgi:hypothetical protein
MSRKPEHHRQARRLVLPSGLRIEIVHPGHAHARRSARRHLHICPGCRCDLVHPCHWAAAREGWQLELICPNCWWSETVLAVEEDVQELEEHLEQGLASLLEDLRQLADANAREEIARFIDALQNDAILPEDF